MSQQNIVKAFSTACSLIIVGGLLASCTLPKGPEVKPDEKKVVTDVRYKPVSYEDLQGWNEDNHSEALISLHKTCKAIKAGEAQWVDQLFVENGAQAAWKKICDVAPKLPDEAAKAFFETAFMPFQVVTGENKAIGKLTAYYTPVVKGSWTRLTPFAAPLYSMPKDLVRGDPRYSRQAIADGVIPADKAIIWINNPVDAFDMQIQGAGEVVMGDGTRVLLEVDGTNGHPWRSPGKKGLNRDVLKTLLLHEPSAAIGMMNEFPRYVFYKIAPIDKVRGAAEIPLTNERSIAIDRRHIPLGTPVWIDGENKYSSIRKLTIAQDVGGAIKGSVRADLYMGRGDSYGDRARKINHKLRMYTLVPRTTEGLASFFKNLDQRKIAPMAQKTPPSKMVMKNPMPAPVQKAAVKKAPKGRYAVQLGAFDSAKGANKTWRQIVARTSPLLDNVVHKLSRYKNFHRLRAGPLATRSAASGLCQELKAVGVACFPVTGMK
ncbi:MAG: MltA domain-containing protein [Alphaproteobacteria bacterium]|nr:MltA domain-containing protein [Rhodospirillales bacterium]MCW9045438.1 MltA domain-containing protein [Alphaproteobacteria bacterium]